MKKKVLSLAVLMASVFTFGSFAQTKSDNKDAACTKTECPAKAKGDKAANRPNPFEGINLTADQQTRLQAIREKAKAERTEQMAQKKAAKAEKKQADATARDARRAEMTKKRQDYLVQIKEVLTPEQYVVFLENCYVQQAPQGKASMGKHARFDKNGNKGGKFAGKGKMKKDGKQGRRNMAQAATAAQNAVANQAN